MFCDKVHQFCIEKKQVYLLHFFIKNIGDYKSKKVNLLYFFKKIQEKISPQSCSLICTTQFMNVSFMQNVILKNEVFCCYYRVFVFHVLIQYFPLYDFSIRFEYFLLVHFITFIYIKTLIFHLKLVSSVSFQLKFSKKKFTPGFRMILIFLYPRVW